jgi:hypothetical protein
MADYSTAAADLKARLDAKAKRRADLYAFFEALKVGLAREVKTANEALVQAGASTVSMQEASEGEPTIELLCGKATCRISQDWAVPSVGAVITGEAGEKTVTFLIVVEEEPVMAKRVSLTPDLEPKVAVEEVAAIFVEALIAGAP